MMGRVVAALLVLVASTAHGQYHRPTGGANRAAHPLSVTGYLHTLPWDNAWEPIGCTPAPYSLFPVAGSVSIPGSAVNTTWTCNVGMSATSGFENVGSYGGLLTAGVGSRLASPSNGGINLAGSGCFINTTADSLPQILNHDQAVCALIRPTGATGYVFDSADSSTNYIRLRMAANTPVLEIRGNGSGNIGLTYVNQSQGAQSAQHLICAKVFDVCEVQSAGRPCMSICVDGYCHNGSEIASDVGTFNAPNFLTAGCLTDETTRLSADVYGIYYSYGASHASIFGTTRADFETANRTMIQKLGIGSDATRTIVMLIGGGQSPMVGASATPVLITTAQSPHFEGIGEDNRLRRLMEGTGAAANETRMSEACNELSRRDPTIQCIAVERGASSTSITVWNDGNASALFDNLELWSLRAATYGCGKMANIQAYFLWHQGENDYPDLADWHTRLAAIQDSMDTLVRAMPCVQASEVVMFMTQSSTWTNNNYSLATADLVTLRQYAAGITDYPTQIRMVGPVYYGPYADGLHPANTYQDRIGRDTARAISTWRSSGAWLPIHMTDANVVGSVVTVDFHVPSPPLSITCDGTDGVTDPGNRGFEWSDASSRTISSFGSVTCDSGVGPTTCHVPITLSGTPGASRTIATGRTGIPNNNAGPTTGARTCIHDAATNAAGTTEPNWAIHQLRTVP